MALVFERVVALVCLIPPGRVVTYGQVATWLGEPRAARTVGWALHGISPEEAAGIVPWHRVIGRAGPDHGWVSTSCLTHTAAMQRALLEDEGVEFDTRERVDLRRFGWAGPAWSDVEKIIEETENHR